MADNSTVFINCCCKSCIIAEAKKLENKNLFADAFQLLHDAELYYSQIAKELASEKKALQNRLNADQRIQLETQSPKNFCRNKNVSVMNVRCHPPLNVLCGKLNVERNLPARNPNKEFYCPVAVFEDKSDPAQKPMYPKDLVYKDGKDIQLEEIRAAMYWEKQKNRGTQQPDHPKSEKKIVFSPGNRIQSSKSEKSSTERISTPSNEGIRRPLQDIFSENQANLPRSEISKSDNAINQRKHEAALVTSSCASPLQKSKVESNKLVNAADGKTNSKSSDATFVCNLVRKTAAILQETYLVEKDPKLPCVESQSPRNEMLQTRKQCDNLDISKVFEESCKITSGAEEQCTTQALPKNEDEENKLPIHMIPPPWDEDEEDNTCNTKAFSVMLPSSTPYKRRTQHFTNGLSSDQEPKCGIGPRASIATTTLNLSMIPETSREKSSSSSGAGSIANVTHLKNLVQDKPTLNAIAEAEEKSHSGLAMCDIANPFDPKLHDELLEIIQFPLERHQNGYHLAKTDIRALKSSNSYKLGSINYTIIAEIGKGNYGRIFRAHPSNKPDQQVALKMQKPACEWEYYISKEILCRLKSEEKLQYFLHYSEIFIFKSCSILLSKWGPYGSLLNFRNAWKMNNSGSQDKYPMAVGVHLSIQIISAADYLHSCRIIHGDIKPDNFIISSVSNDGRPSIKLIDFGRSIDMALLPENTVFHNVIKTEDFTCNEMRDGKPWTYQTDLFGVAGTIYVLLTGEYMKTIKKDDGLWTLKKPLARYMLRDLWDPIFMALLNVSSCNDLPDLHAFKIQLETFFNSFNEFEKRQQFNKMLPIFKNLKAS